MAQLALAAVLTIASWIGYHNSRNRTSYQIYFFNLPLARFTVEMLLLYLYWLIATNADQIKKGAPSALPETILIALVFASYVCWDQIVAAMRKSGLYAELRMSEDRPRRRHVTVGFLGIFAILIGPAVFARSSALVVAIDALLALLVISHRAVQHRVTDKTGTATDVHVGNGGACHSPG